MTDSVDWRARIRPKRGGEDIVYATTTIDGTEQTSIMQPLKDRGGIVFPYTPTILVSGSAEYNPHSFHGSIYPFYTYMQSMPTTLPVTGHFSANTIEEARYLLAVMRFLSSVTKAYYGDSAVQQGVYGTPPPVMLFDYLGPYGFNKVPVIIRSFNYQLANDIEYVPVSYNDTVTMVPTSVDIMIDMAPQYTPRKLRKKFDLNAFTSGKSYKDGFI